MGLLSQIIGERFQKDRDEANAKLDAYRAVIASPTTTPEGKQYALDQLLKTAQIKGKDHGPVSQMFGHLLGIGKKPQQQSQPQAQAQPQQAPQGPSDAPIPGGGPMVQNAPQPQQQAQPQTQIPPMPKRMFKTDEEVQNEQLAYEQKRQDILEGEKAKLQREAEEARKTLEVAKEKARVAEKKTVLRDIPKTAQDPNADPWDYVTVEHHGDGTESVLPGKRPAFVEKTYQEAKTYAATHPDVSIRQAWDKIMGGEVDMQELKKKNIQSTIDNRKQIAARRAATPIGGSKKGGEARARLDKLEGLESKELAAAGGDPAKALENVKGHADKAKEFYGDLYGPLIERLKRTAGHVTKADKEKAFIEALGGKKKPAQGAQKQAQGAPQKVQVTKGTRIHNKQTGKTLEWDGTQWVPAA